MANIIPIATDWNNWQQEPGDSFVHIYEAGKHGKNYGIGNGLNHINNYLYGTHKARYYLIGADSGVGKTTISDFMYILKAWEDCKRLGRKFKCIYCSFEIGKAYKIARWVSYYIFITHGVRLPSDYIIGRIKGHSVTATHDLWVKEAYTIVMAMFQDIDFTDISWGPNYIFDSIVNGYFAPKGKIIWSEVSDADAKRGVRPNVKQFIANDPVDHNETMVMLYIDHLALADEEVGLTTKQNMDLLSKKCITLRNKFGMTIVAVQQFSTDMLAAGRAMATRKTFAMLAPTRLDLGDSKATFRDADTVMGFIAPGKDITEWEGYDLGPTAFSTYLVIAFIMKNRGPANKISPLLIDPVTGYIYDAPYPFNPIAGEPLINIVNQINETCRVYSPLKG